MYITINGKDYNVHIIQSIKKEDCALKYNISNGNVLLEEFSSNEERDEKYNTILNEETLGGE